MINYYDITVSGANESVSEEYATCIEYFRRPRWDENDYYVKTGMDDGKMKEYENNHKWELLETFASSSFVHTERLSYDYDYMYAIMPQNRNKISLHKGGGSYKHDYTVNLPDTWKNLTKTQKEDAVNTYPIHCFLQNASPEYIETFLKK